MALSRFVHPQEGVRFSPYPYVMTGSEGEVRVTKSEEYGMRLVVALATEGGQLTIRSLAQREGLPEATVVPYQALTRRDGRQGVFVLSEDGERVSWREVRPGIRQGDRLQIIGEGLHGEVVVLGQQLLEEGSQVLVTESHTAP